MIYIAICDDQIHQIERIKKCIENMNLKEVNIYTFTDEKEMISFCKNKNRNFIFILDIVLLLMIFSRHLIKSSLKYAETQFKISMELIKNKCFVLLYLYTVFI